MKPILFVLLALGAVIGAFVRYKMTVSPLLYGVLPLNVLIVNIVGSFVLGAFVASSIPWHLDQKYALLVAVGFCGSLTTMSSFAFETISLIDNKHFGLMALNILANVGLSIGAIYAGRSLVTLIVQNVVR